MTDEQPVEVESVPFYKRELTFRRRKATEPEVADAAVDGGEIVAVDNPGDVLTPEAVDMSALDNSALEQPISADEALVDESSPGDVGRRHGARAGGCNGRARG